MDFDTRSPRLRLSLGPLLTRWSKRFCPRSDDQQRLVDRTLASLAPTANGELVGEKQLFSLMRSTFLGGIKGVEPVSQESTGHGDLVGRHVLIAEDEYLSATDLAKAFEDLGAFVLGPVPSVEEGLRLASRVRKIDAAVLDIRLGGDHVFPLADRLAKLDVPFVFVTGYDARMIPDLHRKAPYVAKPCGLEEILSALRFEVF